MKHQLIRFFLLFVSAISLHGASAAPLESILEKNISIESQISLENSIVKLVINAKKLLTIQENAAQNNLEFYLSRVLFLQCTAIGHSVVLAIVDIETNIACYHQSLIYSQIPLHQVVMQTTFYGNLYSDLKSSYSFAVS